MNQLVTKSIGRGFGHDMSSAAILERLRIVNELYQLGKTLATARYVGKVEQNERKSTQRNLSQ